MTPKYENNNTKTKAAEKRRTALKISGLGGWFQNDFMAHALKATDQLLFEPFWLQTIQVAGPKLHVGRSPLQHVPDHLQQRMPQGNQCSLAAAPACESSIQRGEVGVLG